MYLIICIKILFIKFDYWLKSAIIGLFKLFLFKKLKPSHVKNILIFRTGSIGDSICSLPAIKTLRDSFPDAAITILYNSGGSNLTSIENLLDHHIVNNFINYAEIPYKQLLKQLQQQNFDTFIEFPQVHQPFKTYLRNILFAKMVGVSYGVGWKIAATRFLPFVQDKYRTFPSVRDLFMDILQKEGLKIPDDLEYPLNIKTTDIRTIDKILEETNLTTTKFVGIVVGAKRPQNRWPIYYFNDIIDYLFKKDYNIIIVGGKEDTLLAKQLNAYSNIIDLTGRLTPIESAEVLKRCEFVVSNDTGPMHLAYAVNTFVFAIFSSRDYKGLWYPPKEKSVVFRNNDVSCTACFSETCANNLCMQKIKPDTVIKAIDNYLDRKNNYGK